MKTRYLIYLFFAMIVCFNLVAENNSKPNIIFIYADDWGFGDLSCHGHSVIKTPEVDKLIDGGMEFLQFNVNNPVCSPSRAAIMTGHYPARYCIHQHFAPDGANQERGMPDWLDPDAVLLPKLFKQAGYKTAHYGKWHLSTQDLPQPSPLIYGYDESRVWNGAGQQVGGSQGTKTGMIVDYAINFINQNKQTPFFINLWVHESHTPINPPDEARVQYSHISEPKQSYYACISYADTQLGRLFQYINSEGLDSTTLIVFSSDNGPESPSSNPDAITYYSWGETAGLKGQKRSLHEGGIGVPFVVKWPGKVPAGVKNNVTNLAGVDMLPTLCNIAGIQLPDGYQSDGEDMSQAFFGDSLKRNKTLYWEWRGPSGGDNWPRLAIRKGDWKLVSNYEGTQKALYNIQANRIEKADSSKVYTDLADELFNEVAQWKASLPKQPDSAWSYYPPEQNFELYNDFDDNQHIPIMGVQLLTYSEHVVNPSKAGINTSNKVAKAIRKSGKWAKVTYKLPENLDLSQNHTFKLKAYFEGDATLPDLCSIKLMLRNDGVTSTQVSYTDEITKANRWEQLEFDLSLAKDKDTYNQVLVFISSPDNDEKAAGQIFYIDDLEGPPLESISDSAIIASDWLMTGYERPVHIYPVPTRDFLQIDAGDGMKHIWIYNIQGKLVKQQDLNSKSIKMDISKIPKGIYLMEIQHQGGYFTQKKFTKIEIN